MKKTSKMLMLCAVLVVCVAIMGCIASPSNISAQKNSSQKQNVNLTEIMNSGIPYECNVRMNYGVIQTAHYWIKGDMMKMRLSNRHTANSGLVYVIKNDTMYMSVDGATNYPQFNMTDCDWIRMLLKKSDGSGLTEESINANVICSPSSFGLEMFETPGKICDFEEIINMK